MAFRQLKQGWQWPCKSCYYQAYDNTKVSIKIKSQPNLAYTQRFRLLSIQLAYCDRPIVPIISPICLSGLNRWLRSFQSYGSFRIALEVFPYDRLNRLKTVWDDLDDRQSWRLYRNLSPNNLPVFVAELHPEEWQIIVKRILEVLCFPVQVVPSSFSLCLSASSSFFQLKKLFSWVASSKPSA